MEIVEGLWCPVSWGKVMPTMGKWGTSLNNSITKLICSFKDVPTGPEREQGLSSEQRLLLDIETNA